MKKKLLFVIDSLDVAGAEKSLVTLLNLLDYHQYEVDLQLFAYGNPLEQLVPEQVHLLKPLSYTSFAGKHWTSALMQSMTTTDYTMLISRVRYSYQIRSKNCGNIQKARIYWESAARVIEDNPKQYDVAISYAQGVPTFYVAEKITAKRKLAWVNVSYRLDQRERQFQQYYYDRYDKIITVSDAAKEVFLETFPFYQKKLAIQYDINNPVFITKMAEIGEGYKDDFDGVRLLTIGRLAHQKGYDLALEACKKLKEASVHFKWYALGKGPLQVEIEKKIKKMGLTDHFILLGVKANPYPFIKQADIYVQTSRFEGFGLAIAEARMLNIPVVTSIFDAVYNQMVNEKNGLVVERNADDVSAAIKQILDNQPLKSRIIQYLIHEKKGNVEEIENFYQLIEST
ncbi:glycosyltransferase [Gracilibacillus phocaeensis]|uniref:glycosyltransferase n=1 Tax=Gracilibacillus phocaeensis TaxID=2042304 RepID=UPI001030644B|nr:glycosyltransferase [Gracilibacillus phocaeensis]